MFSGETVELLKKISDSHLEMTSKFLNASMDTLNKTNSTLFKPDVIDELKDKINKSSSISQDNIQYIHDHLKLFQYAMSKSMGMEADQVISPDKSDRRFSDESWNENIAFDYIKQFYLLKFQVHT